MLSDVDPVWTSSGSLVAVNAKSVSEQDQPLVTCMHERSGKPSARIKARLVINGCSRGVKQLEYPHVPIGITAALDELDIRTRNHALSECLIQDRNGDANELVYGKKSVIHATSVNQNFGSKKPQCPNCLKSRRSAGGLRR